MLTYRFYSDGCFLRHGVVFDTLVDIMTVSKKGQEAHAGHFTSDPCRMN